jgi:hypothetical protein
MLRRELEVLNCVDKSMLYIKMNECNMNIVRFVITFVHIIIVSFENLWFYLGWFLIFADFYIYNGRAKAIMYIIMHCVVS